MPEPIPKAIATALPEALELYAELLLRMEPLRPFEVEVKNTSVHVVARSAFLGVQFGKAHLRLTIKSDARIDSDRVIKAEQVSKNRWHCEIKVLSPDEIDSELLAWIEGAHALCK